MKSRRRSHRSLPLQSGMTLIELLAVILLLGGMVFGMGVGAGIASEHGFVKAVGGVTGAILGGAAVFISFYLIALPFRIHGAIRRAMEPADLVCKCHDSAGSVGLSVTADTSPT